MCFVWISEQTGTFSLYIINRLVFITKALSVYIVRVIKSRSMRWAGHVVRMGEERGCIGSWWGSRRGRDHWVDLGVDGWIILGWISRRWDVGCVDWIGLAHDRDGWRTLVSAVMNLRVP